MDLSGISGISATNPRPANPAGGQPGSQPAAPRDEFLASGPSVAPKPASPACPPCPVATPAPASPPPPTPAARPPLGESNAPVRLTMALPTVEASALAATSAPAAPPTRAVVRETVQDVLTEVSRQYSAEFLGVGSHVSGANYRDPLAELERVRKAGLPLSEMRPSDHDYRLLLPGSTSLDQAESRYRDVRERLADRLQRALKGQGCDDDQVRVVLANVNLYPPDEISACIATDAEANAFFKSRGLTPNLGGRDVDGLWGEGARTWCNHYEEKAGQRIFMEKGKVCLGRTDLTHLIEQGGFGRLTAEGSANLASQFAEKGLKALDEGRALDLVKDLKRLDQALTRSRHLAMMPDSGESLSDFLEIVDEIYSSSGDGKGGLTQEGRAAMTDLVNGRADLIRRELKWARAEAAVLQTMHKAEGGASRAFYRQLLQRSQAGPWSYALDHFCEQLERVDVGEMVDFAFRYGTMVDLVVKHFAATGDRNRAYEETVRVMEAMGGAVQGLTVAIVDMILEGAKASGIRMAARAQDGENLIGGIYSAWGAQDVRDGPLVRTVNQIASEFPDTDSGRQGLENLVRLHSRRAAQNHNNPDPAFRDQLEEEIFQKCLPEVEALWHAARMEKIQEINRLASGLRQEMEASQPHVWLEDSSDGHLEVPLEKEPPLGLKATLRGSLPLDLEAAKTDLRRIRQLAFELDHNGMLDNSSGRQDGDYQPVLFGLSSNLEVHGPGEEFLGAHRQSVNEYSESTLVPPAARLVLDQFGWHRADLSSELEITFRPMSNDLEQQSVLSSFSSDLKTQASLDFQVARAIPDPADQASLAGPWQAQDSKGVFGGSLDLKEVEGQVRGTYSSRFGVLPVTGSASEGRLHLVFHFDVGPLGRVLQNAELARKVGPITAIADLEAPAGATALTGELLPFNIHYNAEGEVTEVYEGGRVDPKNPARSFNLYRS